MSRVLLIDDEPGIAGLVEMCLDGAEVVAVAGLEDALNHSRRRRPDVVLLDLSLGRQDGLDLIPGLRGEPALAGVPIVAFTIHASRKREALERGSDGFVAKPFKSASLRKTLEPFLRRSPG